jgi:hypothetical protein
MKRTWIIVLLTSFILSACSGIKNDQQADIELESPHVIVYRSPT